jgi:FkbM family methyltransferase
VGPNPTIADLVARRAAGDLDRDAYWSAMSAWHAALLDYGPLLERCGAERLVIEPSGLILELADGTRWTWRPGDRRAPPVVVLDDGEYEAAERRLLVGLMPEGGVALDVGANLGWYTVRLARRAGASGRVHAFEPAAASFGLLETNLHLNGVGASVAPHRIALGESSGEVTLYTPALTGSVAASQRPLFADEPQEIETCPAETLDAFVERQSIDAVALVKCDVEGGELAFLKGARATLESRRPILMVELLRKWSAVYGYHPNDAAGLLAGIGFDCYAIAGPTLAPVPVIDDACPHTNFFFIPHEVVAETLSRAAYLLAG